MWLASACRCAPHMHPILSGDLCICAALDGRCCAGSCPSCLSMHAGQIVCCNCNRFACVDACAATCSLRRCRPSCGLITSNCIAVLAVSPGTWPRLLKMAAGVAVSCRGIAAPSRGTRKRAYSKLRNHVKMLAAVQPEARSEPGGARPGHKAKLVRLLLCTLRSSGASPDPMTHCVLPKATIRARAMPAALCCCVSLDAA